MADNTPIEGEVVSNELAVILNEQGVSPENQKTLVEAFGGPFTEVGDILANFDRDEKTGELVVGDNAIKVTSIEQREDMLKAKEQRLALKRARTTVENKRKELKEDSLKTGRAIDAVAKFVKTTIEPAEKYLEQQEKFAELQAAKELAERLAKRTAAISKYADPSLYNIEHIEDAAFDQLLFQLEKKAADEAEAERKALAEQEATAKAERERQLKIQEENDRLQREAKERAAAEERKLARVNEVTRLGMIWDADKKAYAYLDQVATAADVLELNDVKWRQLISEVSMIFAAARKEAEEKARAEQSARNAELEKERAAAQAEREKREELERQEAERKAAEEKAAADRAAAEHAALLAPDKEKIKAIAPKLEAIKLDLPATKDQKAQEIVANVYDMIEKINAYIETNVEKL
jgi:hypothetical protein